MLGLPTLFFHSGSVLMFERSALMLLLLSLSCMLPGGAQAAPADGKRSELTDLRNKIRAVQDEIAHGEESQEEIADQLANSDKAISAAQRRLREIFVQRQKAETEVKELQAQQQLIESKLAQMRKQLGDAIFRLYVEGGQGGARRFLSGDSPNQLSRDAYYLEQIARQRIVAIEQARIAMVELDRLVIEAKTRQDELQGLEKQRRAEQESLQSERRKQREVLAQVATQLRAQRKHVQSLKRDELRMEKLLRGLEKIARSAPPKSGNSQTDKKTSPEKSALQTGHAGKVVSPESAEADFASRKGRLLWPVAGTINGRFGSPRAEGGASWRGVFIKTSNAADVRAVAAGKVAFADWMRGFGNLVIIDHGEGYMTVYGNNESIFKNPGDAVTTGEVVASSGSSGGLEESGLYFEIRHRGQPQDPAKWMVAK